MRKLQLLFLLGVTGGVSFAAGNSPEGWSLHEWGTFTSLQDESGNAMNGMNSDDEPIPEFVHRLASDLLVQPSDVAPVFYQGAPACHPDVTVRLETPVIYFHPPAGVRETLVDVRVAFQGGWITEYYPNAVIQPSGENAEQTPVARLTAKTRGSLEWKKLKIGTDGSGPECEDHVWTAPRAVQAASVTTAAGESEKFLFYRGVGRREAPISVVRDTVKNELHLHSRWPAEIVRALPARIERLWLVDVKADGTAAFRTPAPLELSADADKVVGTMSASFEPGDYAAGTMKRLRASMKEALLLEGLFADESEALLNTWELSYFKSSGLRLFFMVPRAWTDHVLPLEVNPPMEMKRAMIGRIEIVTPEQRRHLAAIAAGPTSNGNWFMEQMKAQAAGTKEVPTPPDYKHYLELGRLRRVLILDEERRRPTKSMKEFIRAYRLEAAVIDR